jgi:CspA family cold shock protein
MRFKDQLLRCGACGQHFVYTVREQRRRAERGLPLDAPAFCHECRGADVRLAEADTSKASDDPGAEPDSGGRGPSRSAGQGDRKRGAQGRDGGRRGGRQKRGRRTKGGAKTDDKPKGKGKGKGKGAPGGKPRGKRRGGGRSARQSTQTELRVRHLGTVKWYDDDRGYGFIAQEDGEEVFVHCSAILLDGERELEQGQPVEFELEQTAKGLQAVDVVPLA